MKVLIVGDIVGRTGLDRLQAELAIKGYVTNLYGRRYYLEKSTNFYKGNNYLIQGTGADALKEAEIEICE